MLQVWLQRIEILGRQDFEKIQTRMLEPAWSNLAKIVKMIDFIVAALWALHEQKASKVIQAAENLMANVRENAKVAEMHSQGILQVWF